MKNSYENTENRKELIDASSKEQFKNYIQKLKTQLELNLPGEQAQLKMAPPDRPRQDTDQSTRNAGVLILLYPFENDIYTVLIQRPEYNGAHSGQISLPGGKFEFDKDISLVDTAFRETHEEIGVNRKEIHFVGQLTRLFIPVSNNLVQPFIGCLSYKPTFVPDPREVDEIYPIRLSDLLDPQCILKDEIILSNRKSIIAPFYKVNSLQVWGATAMILSEFFEIHKNLMATLR